MQGRAIHAALNREPGYVGSYSEIVRIVLRLRGGQPPEVTVRLEWGQVTPRSWTSARG